MQDTLAASLAALLDRLGAASGLLRREVSVPHLLDWEAHFTQDLPKWRATWGVDASGADRERYYRVSEIESQKVGVWVVAYATYKPRRDLTFRVEVQNIGIRDSRRIREVYAGSRATSSLVYAESGSWSSGRRANHDCQTPLKVVILDY